MSLLVLTGLARAQQPNIVFVLADDLGWTDLSTGRTNGGNGSTYYRTPNINVLAARGMAFNQAYSAAPNCAPTRAALMSGQHAQRTGVYTNGTSNRGLWQFRQLDGAPNTTELGTSVITLAETLRAAGYATGHFGKWHLGDDPNLGPTANGFDFNVAGTSAGIVSGGSNGHFARSDGSWNLPNLPANGIANQFMAERLTDDALQWMGGRGPQPFFCFMSHFSVHTPIQAPAAAIAAFNGVPTSQYHSSQTYAGMIKSLDDQVGRVVAFLENTPDPRQPGQMLIANSVVVFYSDNGGLGGYASSLQINYGVTHQFPLRSGKGSLYEGGIRVPLIVRWDGVVAPGQIHNTPVTTVDLYPTLMAIAGAAPPPGQTLDGADLSPILRAQASGLGRASMSWHFPAYLQASTNLGTWHTTPVSLIRRGDWKLLFYYETRHWELYDVVADVGETNDVAANNPAVVRSLGFELRNWLGQTGASLPRFKGTTTQVPLPDPSNVPVGALWSELLANPPPHRTDAASASDGSGLLVFGGTDGTTYLNDLWQFDGTSWSSLAPGATIPARHRHAAAFDPQRSRLVVFGGQPTSGGPGLADTWEWDGTSWTQASPPAAPSPRWWHTMAYDASSNRVLMFGGEDASGELRDTWAWDGSSWSQLAPTTQPSARSRAAMATNLTTGEVTLFGGASGSGELGDTWIWDGGDWRELLTATTPYSTGTAAAALTHDPLRDRMVLFGGITGGSYRNRTWEFDGVDWRDRGAAPLVARSSPSMAYVPEAGRTFLFGGFGAGNVYFNDTWDYLTRWPAEFTTTGAGCAGSTGIPQLSLQSAAWVGGQFQLIVSSISATAQPFVLLGGSNSNWMGIPLPFPLSSLGAPQCNLLVSLDAILPATPIATVPVPNTTNLVGSVFYCQALVIEPGGLSLSALGNAQIGVR